MRLTGTFKILGIFFLLIPIFTGCRSAPSFHFGSYSEAEKFYEKGQYEKAIPKYEEYIRENPEGNMSVIASYYLAKSYEGLGETGKARQLYEKIVREQKGLIWADFSKERLEELASKPASLENKKP